tara:strand:+ start:72 stop:218 length:147 start_codon:yes stop_codon:yes gene_type:complete
MAGDDPTQMVGQPALTTRNREFAAGMIIIEGWGWKERAVERRKWNVHG